MQKDKLDLLTDEFLQSRDQPPSCGDLHLRISAVTEELPQSSQGDASFALGGVPSGKADAGRRLAWRDWFSLRPIALTGASVFAVSVLALALWLPQIQIEPMEPAAQLLAETVDVANVDAELVWDELLLLQDELAFAQL